MYTERTTRGIARILLALTAVTMVTIIIFVLTSSGPRVAVSAKNGRFIAYSNSDAKMVPLSSMIIKPPSGPKLLVAAEPVYYNWLVQSDGFDNDRNFGPNLWSEFLSGDNALEQFYIHMSCDPRACAATALGLSKELGFDVMPDEACIENETDRVNVAAAHYEADRSYWQNDFDAIAEAIDGLWYNIEEIGDYNSACYMVFNGYDAPPTVIVSPSCRTGGHALVFYRSDGTKIRFRLECAFQLVDVLTTSENKPEPDNPEETTVTTPNTVTTVVTTANSETTTQPENTTVPVTTTVTEGTTTAPVATTVVESTTTVPESTTIIESTTTTPKSTTTQAITIVSESTATSKRTTTASETTTVETTTTVAESTTTPVTTTESTTTTIVTTTPTTTTNLEAKNPEQAIDAKDDANVGGDVNTSDVNDDATSEPDLPVAPATDGDQNTDTRVTAEVALPDKYELTVVQLVPKA